MLTDYERIAERIMWSWQGNLLHASTKLDNESKYLVAELANIAQQSDFSNSDQDRALSWLSSNIFI